MLSLRLVAVAAAALAAAAAAPMVEDEDFWFTDDPQPSPTPADANAEYCTCNPSSIYLDVAFVVDTSNDMTKKVVGDATASLQSVFFGITHGTKYYESNVATIAFADSVQVVSNFGGIRNDDDIFNFQLPFLGGKASKMTQAINTATSLISQNARNFTRGVIVLLSKSYNTLDSANIVEALSTFTSDGGVVITIDYDSELGLQALHDVATQGYYINDYAPEKADQLISDIIYALCDANCFCAFGDNAYEVPNSLNRVQPLGCYHWSTGAANYDVAAQNCMKQGGFVATAHNTQKNFFLYSHYNNSRYWLGYRRNDGYNYEWADGSVDPYTNWAPGNPAGQDCVYAKKTNGLNSMWYTAPCRDALNSMDYACQVRPCDSVYDCF